MLTILARPKLAKACRRLDARPRHPLSPEDESSLTTALVAVLAMTGKLRHILLGPTRIHERKDLTRVLSRCKHLSSIAIDASAPGIRPTGWTIGKLLTKFNGKASMTRIALVGVEYNDEALIGPALRLPALTTLSIAHSLMSGDTFTDLMRRFPNVRYFSLSCVGGLSTDALVEAVQGITPTLVALEIWDVQTDADVQYTPLTLDARTLRHLAIDYSFFPIEQWMQLGLPAARSLFVRHPPSEWTVAAVAALQQRWATLEMLAIEWTAPDLDPACLSVLQVCFAPSVACHSCNYEQGLSQASASLTFFDSVVTARRSPEFAEIMPVERVSI